METRYWSVGRVLAAIAASGSAAAAPENSTESLETVTVTASPLATEELHIAQPVRVLRGERLERRRAPSLGETLSQEPGISSTSFGIGAARPIIRGLSGSRVRILDGGIGSMDISSLSDDHAVSVDAAAASQIEILKGPATLLYGSGAIGGVVNVVNNRIPSSLVEQPTGELGVRYDSATVLRAGNGLVDAAFGPIGLHFDVLKRDTDDYAVPGGTLDNSDTHVENLAGGAAYVGARGHLGFSLSSYNNEYGVPGGGSRIDLAQLRYDLAGQLANPLPGFTLAKFKLGHSDYRHQEREAGGALATLFTNDEYEGRIELTHQPLASMHGVIGMQIQRRDLAALGTEQLTPPVLSTLLGLFAVEERDWHQWHFEFGARYEHADYAPQGADTAALTHDVYSLSGGLVRNLTADLSTALSLTRALRAPSVEELFNNGPHEATQSFEIGSRDLQPEAANNLDFSLRKNTGQWTWRVDAYLNYIQDFIYGASVDGNGDGVPDRIDDFPVVAYRQQDAVFYGTEVENGYHVLNDAEWGSLDLRLFMDYVRAQRIDGNNLPRITPLRFGAGLEYKNGPWRGDFELRRVQAQNDSAPLETTTPGYTLLNLGVSRTWSLRQGELVFSLRGSNLLNEDIRYHTSFLKAVAPQPGRSATLSLRFSF